MEKAIFGASEFFSQEAFTSGLRGIENVHISQLKGRNVDIVEVWFNPWKVSYRELLELFFDLHDPIARKGQQTKNQSFIFFSNIHQLSVAKQKKNELKKLLKDDIITQITPCGNILIPLKEKA
jgi:peptide-methionine (S)-S-oxide reductase